MIEELLGSGQFDSQEILLRRHELIIRPGEREHYIYYIDSGALRAYTLIGEEEFTIRLAYSKSIVAAIPAFFTDEPSDLYIEAIRKTKLRRIKKADFESYFTLNAERLSQYNQLLKELVASFYEREIDLLTSSPAERINRMLKRSPHVFQEIPYKYIASYLRMSPETLSRLLNLDSNQDSGKSSDAIL